MKCPRCGLINPDNAMHCDCGFDFQTGSAEAERERKEQLSRDMRKQEFARYIRMIPILIPGIIMLIARPSSDIGTAIVFLIIFCGASFPLYLQRLASDRGGVVIAIPVCAVFGLGTIYFLIRAIF